MSPRRLAAQRLDEQAFSPFGWLPAPEGSPEDLGHRLEFLWGDAHLNLIAHHPEEVLRPRPGTLRCDRLYRHATHTQALVPLGAPGVVVVARPERVDELVAFVVAPHQAFVLHRGTWHWGPHPLGGEALWLLNLQGRRYLEDNESIELTPPVEVEVR
jgi:ureidoglycolate hydrolase